MIKKLLAITGGLALALTGTVAATAVNDMTVVHRIDTQNCTTERGVATIDYTGKGEHYFEGDTLVVKTTAVEGWNNFAVTTDNPAGANGCEMLSTGTFVEGEQIDPKALGGKAVISDGGATAHIAFPYTLKPVVSVPKGDYRASCDAITVTLPAYAGEGAEAAWKATAELYEHTANGPALVDTVTLGGKIGFGETVTEKIPEADYVAWDVRIDSKHDGKAQTRYGEPQFKCFTERESVTPENPVCDIDTGDWVLPESSDAIEYGVDGDRLVAKAIGDRQFGSNIGDWVLFDGERRATLVFEGECEAPETPDNGDNNNGEEPSDNGDQVTPDAPEVEIPERINEPVAPVNIQTARR